jgi:hypothetical protein
VILTPAINSDVVFTVCCRRKTGYGSYGDLVHGARIIQLKQGTPTQDALTWIATESGARTYQQIYIRAYSQEQVACTSEGVYLQANFGRLFFVSVVSCIALFSNFFSYLTGDLQDAHRFM